MTYASKLKVQVNRFYSCQVNITCSEFNQFSYILVVSGSTFKACNIFKCVVLIRNIGRRKLRLIYCLAILQRGFHFCIYSPMKYSSHTSYDLEYFKPGKHSDG